MTHTITLWPIIKALLQAAVFVSNGTNISNNWYTQWQTTNEKQQQFVQKYLAQHTDIATFKPDELKAWASKDYQELNAILAKEHFAIQLQPFPKNGFGVVAILDVMMEWQSPGTAKKILTKDNTMYAGVEMERGFTVLISDKHAHPIIRLETKSGDSAWLTIADKPRKDFDLLKYIDTIKKNLRPDESYQSVIFPKIDLDQQPDITWLLRMSYAGYFIAQTLQQTKLKMNEFGAHVQSAAAIAMMRSMPPTDKKTLVIDKPFICWIEKPGVSIPIFAGYLDVDVWKDPGSLDMRSSLDKKTKTLPIQKEQASMWLRIKMVINEWWSNFVEIFS
jgi:hypothetical protein